MALIELQDVYKNYPLGKTVVKALRGINLKVERGSFIALAGSSGSGKTTLLNLIGCIDTPTSGTLLFDDQKLGNMSDKEITRLRLHKIGFIFQMFNLIPVLTAVENVELPLLLASGESKVTARKRAEQLLESVNLKDFRKHRPSELSGGQRQRVAIARALVTNPLVVLADEPTANLDSETGETILSLMKDMNEKRSTTFIFSTHDANVMKYAGRIERIKDGIILETGS